MINLFLDFSEVFTLWLRALQLLDQCWKKAQDHHDKIIIHKTTKAITKTHRL